MGNTIANKPSGLTPTTATLLAEVFNEVGAPKGYTMWFTDGEWRQERL